MISFYKDGIISMHVENAVKTISDSDYGIHCLVIYPDLETLREFYSHYIQKQIGDKNEIVQIAPFYETEDSVRHTLSQGHRAIDIDRIENKEKVLLIMDSLENYFSQEDVKPQLESNRELVGRAKSVGKKGVSILGDLGAFAFKKRINDLSDYELSLPSHYDIDLKGICLYHQKDFNRLSQDFKQKLLNHHEMAIKL